MLRLRLNATSRKLIICMLASMVIRNPLLLKMRHISFLMFSVSLGLALVIASPAIYIYLFQKNVVYVVYIYNIL